MKKHLLKIISAVLIAALLVTGLPISALAADISSSVGDDPEISGDIEDESGETADPEYIWVNLYQGESEYYGEDGSGEMIEPEFGSIDSGITARAFSSIEGDFVELTDHAEFLWMFTIWGSGGSMPWNIPVGITEEGYKQYVIDAFCLDEDYWETHSFEDFNIFEFEDYNDCVDDMTLMQNLAGGNYDGVVFSNSLSALPAYTKEQISAWYNGSWFSGNYENARMMEEDPDQEYDDEGTDEEGNEESEAVIPIEESGDGEEIDPQPVVIEMEEEDAYGLDFTCVARYQLSSGDYLCEMAYNYVTMVGKKAGSLSGSLVYGGERTPVESDTVIEFNATDSASGLFAVPSNDSDLFRYMWFYSLTEPQSIDMESLIPVSFSAEQWNQMKYGEDDELITHNELYSAYPKLWLTDNEFPVADYNYITGGNASSVGEGGLYLCCLAGMVSRSTVLTSAFMGDIAANVKISGEEDPTVLKLSASQDFIAPANLAQDNVTLTVDTLRYIDGELSYQWYRVTNDGNEPVIGETSADFSAPIPNTEEETYTYFCEVSTSTASGTSRYIHVTRTAEWALFERVPDIYVSPDAQYYTTVTIEYNPSAKYRVSWYSNTEPNYNGTEYNSYTHYGYDELDLDLPDGDEPLYYYFYATDNTGKTYRSNIIQVIRTGVSLGELELTRLFNPASHEAPGYNNTDIYQYIGAETYAYLSCYESYSHSDHFEATFYRADDEGFTENVSVLGTISTDRLSEYSSVDNAIFDLGLKFRVPSDTVGEYYVRAEYTNSYEGESRTATTNSIKVVNEDKTKEEYFKFNESSGIISAYYGTEETVVFPTEINGVAVTELDYLAGITYRTWADTVERTGKSYRNIVIPEGIGKVSDYCFLGQRYLTDITLPNSLHTVGNFAFYNCPNVTTITVGEGNTESGMYGRAFNAGDFSFSKLPKLTYVDLSAIEGESAFWGAFTDCPNLTKITAPVFGTAYFREASYNSNYLNYINPFNKSINLLEIENVENTGVAYKWNTNVSYSVLPVYVMIKDGYGTADYDDNFVYLSDEANSGYIIAALRRNVVNGNGSMEFPSSFKDVPITRIGVNHQLDAFLESGVYATSVVIPEGVKTIGEKAFLEMYTLETVELPLSLKEINSFAFHTEGYNSNIIVNGEVQRGHLTSVNLNETSLSYVGSYAFYNQKLCDFGDLDFIDGAYIGEYAFAVYFQRTEERTENLSSVTARGNLWVGRDAFLNRFSLRSLSVSGTLKLDQDAFENCYFLETAEYSGEIEDGEQHDTSRGFTHLRYTLAAPTVTDTKYYSNGYYNSYYQKTYRRVGDFGYSYTRTVKNEGTSSEPIWVVNGDKVVTMELYLRLDETNIVIPSVIESEEIQTVNLASTLEMIEGVHDYSLYLTDGIQTLSNVVKNSSSTEVLVSLQNCTSVRLPNSIQEIPSNLFTGGKLSGTLEIPASVTKVASKAFARNNIDALILHNGLREIEYGAFSSGYPDYDTDFKYYSYHTNYDYNSNSEINSQISSVSTAEKSGEEGNTLPSTLDTVGYYAFADCAIEGKLTLPSSLRVIRDGALYGTPITELVSENAEFTTFGNNNWNTTGNGYTVEQLAVGVFGNCPNLEIIDLSEAKIQSINSLAFNTSVYGYSSGLTTENLSSPVTKLRLPRNLQYLEFSSLRGIDPSIQHFTEGLKTYNVEFCSTNINNRPTTEYSIALPESVNLVHDTIFNLGTVTFYNRDQYKEVHANHNIGAGNYTYTDLPTEIPSTCTVRCYEGSYIHNWCVTNNINYELIPEPPTTLSLSVKGVDEKVFTTSDFTRIDWIDETDDYVIRTDTLACPVHEFNPNHVYSVRLWLTGGYSAVYDFENGSKITFDPSSVDFSTTQEIILEKLGTVYVVGSFGEQAGLSGLSAYASSNVTGDRYTVTINSDGTFYTEVPRTSVNLTAQVSDEVHYMPLTVKNIAYRPLGDNKRIDLGVLTLPEETILDRIPLSSKASGIVSFTSTDGSKYAEGSIRASGKNYYINTDGIENTFSRGDEVVMRIYDSAASHSFAPYTFNLPGEKEYYYSPITLTQVENAKVTLPAQSFNTRIGAYDRYGYLTASITSTPGNPAEFYLPGGDYTLIAFQNAHNGYITLPATLAEFNSNSYDIAGYAKEEVTLSQGESYTFESEIPGFVIHSAVSVSFSSNSKLADKESGGYPVYLRFNTDENARYGETTFRLTTTDGGELPFCEYNGTYAFMNTSGAKCEVGYSNESANRYLDVTTDIFEGTICFYVRPTGQSLKLSINGSYKTVYVIPANTFQLSAPPETTSSANGALALNYTNAALSTAIVYVDGEEVSSTELKVGAASKARLPYILPTDEETDTNHSIYVSVLDGEGISVWQSYTYSITHTVSPAPVPKVLNIRVSNENASDDGKARVSNASYNFVTGEYNAMKLIFPNESFNPDGTIAKDITFDYYLELDNPELVPYGEIYLSVWCNEDEPVIQNVILTYNEASDTFDGKLKFPGGTKTVFYMPYGFDIDIPTEGNNEEISQEIIDKADTLAGLFSDFNDEEVAQHYSTDMDIDIFRYVLNNDEELQVLTKDEKQSLVEVAEARNDINEAYRDLSAKIQENLSGMYDDELLGDWNAVFEANDIYAVSLDTEGLTEGILLSQGYKKYDTAGGVFYVLTMDDRSVVVSLSNNFSITFAENSRIIDAIKGKNSKSVNPVSAQDAKLHLENSFNNWADNFHTLYTKLYSPALLFVSAVDGAMDGILGLIEAISKYNDKKDDIIEKLELRDKDILDVVKKKVTVTEVQIGGTKLDTKDWKVVDVLDESQITKSSKNFFGSFKEYILLMRNEVAKFINKGPQYLKAGGKALKVLTFSGMQIVKHGTKLLGVVGGVLGIGFSLLEILEYLSEDYEAMVNIGQWIKYPEKMFYLYDAVVFRAIGIEAFAANPKKSFMDISDWYYDNSLEYYADLESFVEAYKLREDVNLGISIANLIASAASFSSNFFAEAASFAISLGTYVLDDDLDERYEKLGEDLNRFLKNRGEYFQTKILNAIDRKAINNNYNQVMSGHTQDGDMAYVLNNRPSYWIEPKKQRMKDLFNFDIYEFDDSLDVDSVDQDWLDNLDKLLKEIENSQATAAPEDSSPNHNTECKNGIDPSGYVYEAVASNRIEGATAEIYYKDKEGNEQRWDDSADYDEINPQTTDSFGEYGWMTPIGQWKVKITKDGYYPADSSGDPAAVDGWLPVPPPQLNVNIGLVSTAAPEVASVAAASDRIQIAFSQYMDISSLEDNNSLITVTQNGEEVPLGFTFADREESPTEEGKFYGRILTITRTDGESFENNHLNISISKDFPNYAGTGFENDYLAENLPVTQIVGSIEHSYADGFVGKAGKIQELSVTVKDTTGAPIEGETVTVSAVYGDLYRIENSTAVTDENGKAVFEVTAIHEGSEIFTFTTENGISATVETSNGDTQSALLGDVNGDGIITVVDVTAVQRYIAQMDSLMDVYVSAADVNGDGTVDIIDATVLQKYLAEFELPYPIGQTITI